MTNWFNKLNLTPTERRLVLVAMVIVAVILNYWLVWPYLGEWEKMNQDMVEQERLKQTYLREIAQKPTYERRLQELQRQGAQVPPQEAANRFQQTIFTEASSAGVQINRTIPQVTFARTGSGQTNQFFEERIIKVDLEAGETELVNFLYRLGAGDSMIRVRDVTNLRLHPTRTKLTASLDLVASFPLRRTSASPPTTPTGRTTPAPTASAPASSPTSSTPAASATRRAPSVVTRGQENTN